MILILNLKITSFADIPAGTGLGSSGAFTVSLVSAIKKKIGKKQTKKNIWKIPVILKSTD